MTQIFSTQIASVSFAKEQLIRLETLLAENVGVAEIRQGDRVIRYDDLLKQYSYWESRVATEEGSRPRSMNINLGNF